MVRSRLLFITASCLAQTSGCGRLAYETLSPLTRDAGDEPSDGPAPTNDAGSPSTPTSASDSTLTAPSTQEPPGTEATAESSNDAESTSSRSSVLHSDVSTTSDAPTSAVDHTSTQHTEEPTSGTASSDTATFDTVLTETTTSETVLTETTTSETVLTETTTSETVLTETTAPETAPSETAPNGTASDATSLTTEPTPDTSMAASTSAPTESTGASDSATSDATDSTTPCTTPGAFLPPVAVTGLPAPAFSPSLSADRLTLYFASNGEIYTAVRSSADSLAFTDVTPLTAVNTGGNELTPQLSRDGLRLYFARGDDPMRDIYVSTRASTAEAFGAPSALTSVNSASFTDMLPRESADGRELFFTSLRGANLFDIWVARRNNLADAYGAPSVVTELTTSADESPGGLSSDALMMVMTSKRAGTLGGQDLWTTTRSSTATAFGNVANEAVLNTTFSEFDPTLSADDLELLFASDRDGSTRVYSALRECTP